MAIETPIHDALAAELIDTRHRDHVIRLRQAPIPHFPMPDWTQAVASNA